MIRIPDATDDPELDAIADYLLSETQQPWGLLTAENRLLHASPALCALTGRSRQQLIAAGARERPWLTDPPAVRGLA